MTFWSSKKISNPIQTVKIHKIYIPLPITKKKTCTIKVSREEAFFFWDCKKDKTFGCNIINELKQMAANQLLMQPKKTNKLGV